MKVLCYSSFTFGYLNRARVLFQSVKRHHPDWHCVALITDEPPSGFEWRDDEPMDEIVYAKDLDIPDFRQWLFKHDIVEVCTAVKGPFALHACSLGYDAVIYRNETEGGGDSYLMLDADRIEFALTKAPETDR